MLPEPCRGAAALRRVFAATVVTRTRRGEHPMLRKYRRPALAAGLFAAIAVVLALFAGASGGGPAAAKKSPKLSGDPDRASLKNRTTPGISREGSRHVSELAAEEAANRAFP